MGRKSATPMMSADKIINELLPLLPESDLALVRARLDSLTGAAKDTPRRIVVDRAESEEENFARELYEALSEEVLRRVRVKLQPWVVFTKSAKRCKMYRDAAARAKAVHDTWFPKMARAERASMLRLYAELCYDHVSRGKLAMTDHPIGVKLAFAVTDLPHLIDRAYPGYAASGLLPRVSAMRFRGGPSARV